MTSKCVFAVAAQHGQDITAASAVIPEQFYPRQPVCRQASDSHPRSQHVVRLRAVDELARLLGAQMCFYDLCQIRAIRRQLGREVTARLVTARVLLRLEYCNAVLTRLSTSTLAPFQQVLTLWHVPFWIVSHVKVTPALQELHWLPVAKRIPLTNCACWFISHCCVIHQSTSQICWHWQPK